MSGAAKSDSGNCDVSIYEIMERCALDETDGTQKTMSSKGMIFISTPFSRAATPDCENLIFQPTKWFCECNNYPLLEHIASGNQFLVLE
jgi:N-acetylneuraminate synthase